MVNAQAIQKVAFPILLRPERDSNPRMVVLQTTALPLRHLAIKLSYHLPARQSLSDGGVTRLFNLFYHQVKFFQFSRAFQCHGLFQKQFSATALYSLFSLIDIANGPRIFQECLKLYPRLQKVPLRGIPRSGTF